MTEHDTRFTVLIVDDDASVRDALSLLLSLRGYRTAVFACAEDLLRALEPDAAGCVIADIKMPGIDGISTLTRLRQQAPALPAIVLTGYLSPDTIEQCSELGGVQMIRKPFAFSELSSLVASSLKRGRS